MIGQELRDALAPVLVITAIGLAGFTLARCLVGCGGPSGPQLPAYCTEEALYTAALVRCVDKAETLTESKACRAQVDRACGIVETVTVRKP